MIKVKLDKEVISYISSKSELLKENAIGVYFLKFNDTVVYVGQSSNIKGRIKNHLAQKIKVFNDFSFVECSKNTLNSTETSYIMMYDPVFNKKDSLTKGETLEEFCITKAPHIELEDDVCNSLTQKRLATCIKDIKEDIDFGCSVAFLSRKYFVSRPTMKAFLIKEGVIVA